MDETARRGLEILWEVRNLHLGTAQGGKPRVRVISAMLFKDDGLYFITARGKHFHRQLKADTRLAVSGMNSAYQAVRVSGRIRFLSDREVGEEIFRANPAVADLYPEPSRGVMEAFHLYRGVGEIFDLSAHPPRRVRFAFGGDQSPPVGYSITEDCVACGECVPVCPAGIITPGEPYVIERTRCLECGNCLEACPAEAVAEPAEL